MISKKMEDALNEQVNAELFSAYFYLSMESWFKSKNLNGFANWIKTSALFKSLVWWPVGLFAISKPETVWCAASDSD